MEKKFGLSSPWNIYYKEIKALFGDDPEVTVFYDEETGCVKLYVDNPDKAEAIGSLLPNQREFGNVTIIIEVIPSNRIATVTEGNVFDRAFAGNPAFAYTEEIKEVFANTLIYVVFAPEVVQYYSDNLGDIHGLTSTLYQNIAADLFCVDGAMYCTDRKNGK